LEYNWNTFAPVAMYIRTVATSVHTYVDAKYDDTAPSHLYVYLGHSLPMNGCACENVRDTYGHMDRANTGIHTGVAPEMYD